MSFKAAVLGASEYAGAELLRLLAVHPEIDVTVATAGNELGQTVGNVFPHLSRYSDLDLEEVDAAGSVASCDVVFSALPTGVGMRMLPHLDNDVVIDLSGDFCLHDANDFVFWHGTRHLRSDQLGSWAYGLPELFRESIVGAKRIAIPGPFATAATLAIAPLVKHKLIHGVVSVNVLAGASTLRRTSATNGGFAELNDNVIVDKVAIDEQTPEVEMALMWLAGADAHITVSMISHLVPVVRGVSATASALATPGTSVEDCAQAYEADYGDEPFVIVWSNPVGTKMVRGANTVAMQVTLDGRANQVIASCVLDNLMKGSAGQAIQCANLALGLPEITGLTVEGVYP